MIFSLLTAAVIILEPPKAYQLDAPSDVQTIEVPIDEVQLACALLGLRSAPIRGETALGCWIPPETIILAQEDTDFPYNHACWLKVKAHEDAHAKGWAANHPNARAFTCYPK